jgi:hypothetical protein
MKENYTRRFWAGLGYNNIGLGCFWAVFEPILFNFLGLPPILTQF